jgi:hypothetical protein
MKLRLLVAEHRDMLAVGEFHQTPEGVGRIAVCQSGPERIASGASGDGVKFSVRVTVIARIAELREMQVSDACLVQGRAQRLLGEPCLARHGIQPHVHESLDAPPLQRLDQF